MKQINLITTIFFAFFIIIAFVGCDKTEMEKNKAEQKSDFSNFMEFKEWAGDRMQKTNSEIPGMDAYNYYPTQDSEPQTIYVKNTQKDYTPDDYLTGNCSKMLLYEYDPELGGTVLFCTGSGDECDYVITGDGTLALIMCGTIW